MAAFRYEHLIPENVAPKNATAIGVYNSNGTRITTFDLGGLAFPSLGEKLYSMGVLSDIHVSDSVETSEADFRRALSYFQDVEKVDFICIAGDLTQYSETAEWELYARCVAEESENTPVYPIGGNHDAYGTGLSDAKFQQYTGHELFYTFEQGEDVFIMMSQGAWASQSGNVQPFHISTLQSLYETLEVNRNKRCFVFQHIFPWEKAGDPFGSYNSNSFFGTQGQVIHSLMEHYPNALWFHGHSHQTFETQEHHEKATYDNDFGCHNIHVPSCALPVYVTASGRTDLIQGSQGYVADVYENAVVLRGIDFVDGKFLPIAMYCLDTTLKTVTTGTYVDSTGTITV